MTVSTTTRKVATACNGVVTAFDFTFPINQEEDMSVIIRDADGVETTLALTTNFEVTGENNSFANGGTVTTVSYATGVRALYAWPTGNTIILARVTPKTQATKYVENQKFSQGGLMNDLDKLCMLVQELSEQMARSLSAPISDAGTDYEIPNETARANKYLAFGSSGQPIISGGPSEVPLSVYGESLVQAANLAAFLAALGSANLTAFAGLTGSANKYLYFTGPGAMALADLMSTKNIQMLDNLGLTASVGSNALTIALKGADGNDPSASNVVTVAFRSSTITTGTPVFRTVTGALSITVPDTKSPGFSASENGRMYVWLIDNAGTPELAISRTADIFPEGGLVSTSAVSGASSATVMYSTTARSNLACRCIGYIEIQLGASSHWSNAATKIQVMGAGVKRTGDIVQITLSSTSAYATGNTAIPLDDTIPQITEGFEVLTNSITPTSTLNKLIIDSDVNLCGSAANAVTIALFQDATANALAAGVGVTDPGTHGQMRITYSMVAGTVSATTFRTRVGNAATNAIYINGVGAARLYGGVASTTMKVTEVFA